MSQEHKRPLYAFLVLLVACSLVMVHGLRSEAVQGLLRVAPAAIVAGVELHAAPARPVTPPEDRAPEALAPSGPDAARVPAAGVSRGNAGATRTQRAGGPAAAGLGAGTSAGPDGAGPGRPGKHRTGKHRTGKDRTGQDRGQHGSRGARQVRPPVTAPATHPAGHPIRTPQPGTSGRGPRSATPRGPQAAPRSVHAPTARQVVDTLRERFAGHLPDLGRGHGVSAPRSPSVQPPAPPRHRHLGGPRSAGHGFPGLPDLRRR